MNQSVLYPQALRSLAFGSVAAGYTAVGAALALPARLAYFFNGTDAAVIISWDGTTDHQFLPAGGFLLLDIATNATKFANSCVVPAQTRFFVKRAAGAPSSGDFYISLYGDKP